MLRQGNINSVIEILNENVENDFFNCLAITGAVRRGKSRLANIITKGVYPPFTYEKNYIGNPKHGESFKRMFDSPPKSASWIDEGEKILSAERRMDKEQWWLQQLFNQFASHNKTIVICTPSFKRIDSRWRQTHITIWIHIFERGKAILLRNRDIQSSGDIWGLDAMKESENKMEAGVPAQRIIKNFDQNPCALFYFTFPDWDSEEQKNEYLHWKELSQKDLRSEFDSWEKKLSAEQNSYGQKAKLAVGRFSSYMYFQNHIDYGELAMLTGYTKEAIRVLASEFEIAVANGQILKEDLPNKYFKDDFFQYCKIRLKEAAVL